MALWCSDIRDLRSRLVCPFNHYWLVSEEKSCFMVYQVPRQDYRFVYIGQTKRDLNSRISEHQRAIKNQRSDKSALSEHFLFLKHTINWSEVKVLKAATDYLKRLFAESWFINENPEVMNRKDSHTFPSVYKKLRER